MAPATKDNVILGVIRGAPQIAMEKTACEAMGILYRAVVKYRVQHGTPIETRIQSKPATFRAKYPRNATAIVSNFTSLPERALWKRQRLAMWWRERPVCSGRAWR